MSRGWKTQRERKTGGTVEHATSLHPRHLCLETWRHQEKVFITIHEMQVGWRVKYLLGRFFLKIKRPSVSLRKLNLWDPRLNFEESDLKLATSVWVQTKESALTFSREVPADARLSHLAKAPSLAGADTLWCHLQLRSNTIQTTSVWLFLKIASFFWGGGERSWGRAGWW